MRKLLFLIICIEAAAVADIVTVVASDADGGVTAVENVQCIDVVVFVVPNIYDYGPAVLFQALVRVGVDVGLERKALAAAVRNALRLADVRQLRIDGIALHGEGITADGFCHPTHGNHVVDVNLIRAIIQSLLDILLLLRSLPDGAAPDKYRQGNNGEN